MYSEADNTDNAVLQDPFDSYIVLISIIVRLLCACVVGCSIALFIQHQLCREVYTVGLCGKFKACKHGTQ